MHLLHIPHPTPHPPYTTLVHLQRTLRRRLLTWKDHLPTPTTPRPPPPPPTLLSFTPSPTYTLGRRQTAPLSPSELSRLRAPLRPLGLNGPVFHPQVHSSPRGGLVTYHGPGQVVLWPVMDLRSPSEERGGGGYRNFTVRCYARLLEDTTIAVLRKRCGIAARTTDDPGVWTGGNGNGSGGGGGEGDQDQDALRKIAALGVHLRRHVTGLGVAVNVSMPAPDSTDEETNPWARIVACGLDGKGVTSVRARMGEDGWRSWWTENSGRSAPALGNATPERTMARWWAEELAGRIGVEGVEEVVTEEEIERMVVESGVVGEDEA